MRNNQHFPIPKPLSVFITLGLLALSAHTSAATVQPGTSHTINPGDIAEDWRVGTDLGAASLTMNPGSQALSVRGEPGSVLSINGGTVRNISGSSSSMYGLVSQATASLSITGNSLIVGKRGLSLIGDRDPLVGRLYLKDSKVLGTESYGMIQSGSSSFMEGSEVVGETAALVLVARYDPTEVISRDSNVSISNTIIRSNTGPAINVGLVDNFDLTRANSIIIVENGSQLIGGNGNALEVLNGSTVDLSVLSSDIVGDIFVSSGASATVALRDDASLRGKVTNVDSITVDTAARWILTGDSGVGALRLGDGGVVALGDGESFNTLTVLGDFDGNGGTLVFNTVLAGDGSQTDRVLVNGNTSGITNIAVNNVGGVGAPTVDGIALIEVMGASDGVFELSGRAVGGQYEYFLHKGGSASAGSWYLRSELPTPPDPCKADPSLPGCGAVVPPDPDPCKVGGSVAGCPPIDPPVPPMPILRPEPGAYLANQQAAIEMFGLSFHDRNTAVASSQQAVWARVSRRQADYGVINDQLTVSSDTDVLQVGVDIGTWGDESNGHVGVMLGTGRSNNAVSSRITGYSAKGKVRGRSIGVYGAWLQDPASSHGLYVDTWAQYADFKNTVQGDGLTAERYKGAAKTVSFEAGYGIKAIDGALTDLIVQPQVQATYSRLDGGVHREANGTLVQASEQAQFTGRLGVRAYSQSAGAVNRVHPYLAVNWIHGSDDNSISFDGVKVDGGVPKRRYEAIAGAQLQLGNRWSAWGDMRWQQGSRGYREISGQVGLGAAW